MRTLKKGDRGNDVKEVQNIINQIGFDCGTADGIFGIKTEEMVKQFQGTFGLKVDGIVGIETYTIINKAIKINHFKVNEFRCKHCKKLILDINLLLKLEELRTLIGNKPIIINSGYRCITYNKSIDGAKNSQHLYGKAADIKAIGISIKELGKYADKIFSKGGVGYGDTFIHVDIRGYKTRWSYS